MQAKWVSYSGPQARDARAKTSERQGPRPAPDAAVSVKHLALMPVERQAIEILYSSNNGVAPYVQKYLPLSDKDQEEASAELCSHGLDTQSRRNLSDKWRIVWSTQGKGRPQKNRVLLQW